MYGQSCQDALSLGNNLSRCFVFCQVTMHVYLHLISECLHVHVNIYMYGQNFQDALSLVNNLSRCVYFHQIFQYVDGGFEYICT